MTTVYSSNDNLIPREDLGKQDMNTGRADEKCHTPELHSYGFDSNEPLRQKHAYDDKAVSRIALAAACVKDAKQGRRGWSQFHAKSKYAQLAFHVDNSPFFQVVIYFAVILHACLTFIESPSVQLDSIEILVATVLNMCCLVLYALDICVIGLSSSWNKVWTKSDFIWSRVEFVFLCLFVVDWVLLLIQVSIYNSLHLKEVQYMVQPFRCLRLATIICKSKNVAHVFRVTFSISFKLGKLIFIMVVYILVFACIGTHLLMPSYPPSGISYTPEACMDNASNTSNDNQNLDVFQSAFDNIGLASLKLFILFTTENYPNVIFPGYQMSQFTWFYFGAFIFIGVFILAPLLLAVIADLYWEHNKKHVKKERSQQRILLIKAWNLLANEGQEKLPVDCDALLKLFRLLKPKNTAEENLDLLYYLDDAATGYIDWVKWVTDLLDVLELEKAAALTNQTVINGSSTNKLQVFFQKLTTWKFFNRLSLFLIILYCLLFLLKWREMDPLTDLVIHSFRTFLSICFVFEITFRVLANRRRILHNHSEILEIVLVAISFVSNTAWYSWYALSPSEEKYFEKVYYLKGAFVVTSSLAILIRLFYNSVQSRKVLSLLVYLFPIMWDLLILFMVFMFAYAVIGMEVFRHVRIAPDSMCYDHFKYECGLGFVNFKCSLLIIFQIVTTNNWHDIMNAVIYSSGYYVSSIYFIAGFVILNLLMMNLLVSIGLEAVNHFSRQSAQTLESESSLETDHDVFNNTKIGFSSKNLKADSKESQNKTNIMYTTLSNMKTFFGDAFKTTRNNSETGITPHLSQPSSRTHSSRQTTASRTREMLAKSTRSNHVISPQTQTYSVETVKSKENLIGNPQMSNYSSQHPKKTFTRSVNVLRAVQELRRVSEVPKKVERDTDTSISDIEKDLHTNKSPPLVARRLRKASNDSSTTSGGHRSSLEEEKKKFVRSRRPVNWRAQIQDVTLINSTEFHELKKQLRGAQETKNVTGSEAKDEIVLQSSENMKGIVELSEDSNSELSSSIYSPQDPLSDSVGLGQTNEFSHSLSHQSVPILKFEECVDDTQLHETTNAAELETSFDTSLGDSYLTPSSSTKNRNQPSRTGERNVPERTKDTLEGVPSWIRNFTEGHCDTVVSRKDSISSNHTTLSNDSLTNSTADVFDLAFQKATS